MINLKCIYCGSSEFELKSIYLETKNINNATIFDILKIVAKEELYYMRICTNCGHSSLFNAKIIDKENQKNMLKGSKK